MTAILPGAARRILSRTHSRALWRWCLVYTVLVPGPQRRRRREELLDHLWESERAREPARRVVAAALRGVPDDLFWVGVVLGGLVLRSLRSPMTYVVASLAGPLAGWFASATQAGRTAHAVEATAMIAGGVLLGLAALVRWTRRQ